jgi:hypothetical protein
MIMAAGPEPEQNLSWKIALNRRGCGFVLMGVDDISPGQ